MDSNIYYDITNNRKYEYIRTNNKIVLSFIENAQKYYDLKIDNKKIQELGELKGIDGFYPFKMGSFVLYILSNCDILNCENNIKINYIKQYLEECIINNKYFTEPILLSFIRDVLQLPHLKYSVQFYCKGYFNKENNLEKVCEENLKTKLSIFKKNKNEIIIEKTYVCDDLVMFILVSLYEILSNKYKIHKCINCGKIFINNKKDTNTRYCNYISPQDKKKTCFKYRQNATYQEVKKSNKIYFIHGKIYDLLKKRRDRAESKSKENNLYKDDIVVKECQKNLDNFNCWYRKKTKEYKNRNLTEEQFIKLLEEQYKKYKEERKNGSTRNNKK